jgi:hypothetical protein
MIPFQFFGYIKLIICFPMSIFLILILLNVLYFEHVFCNLLVSSLNNYMFYVLGTSYFIVKKNPRGTKWKEGT